MVDNRQTLPNRWHCNWNWCPRTFYQSRDLLDHLRQEHFDNILKVEKDDWDAHLRAYTGQSGGTDSLMKAIPTQFSDFPTTGSGPEQSSTHDKLQREPSLGPSQSRSPVRPTTPPLKARGSFASYAAQSSPSPVPNSLPPSPALNYLVADALNSVAAINAGGPPRWTASRPASQRKRVSPATAALLPLPRGLEKSPDKTSPITPFGTSRRDSSDSSSSARDVESQLTTNVETSPSIVYPLSQSQLHTQSQSQSQLQSQSQSQPQSLPRCRSQSQSQSRFQSHSQPQSQSQSQLQRYPPSYPADPYPPIRTQALYDSQQSIFSLQSSTRSFTSGEMVLNPTGQDAVMQSNVDDDNGDVSMGTSVSQSMSQDEPPLPADTYSDTFALQTQAPYLSQVSI